MTLIRTIFTIAVAASLAILPARVGAIGVPAGSGTIVSMMTDCASMDDVSCESTPGMSAVGQAMPMSGDCDQSGDHGTKLPGACSTYCNSVPALPTTITVPLDIVLLPLFASAIAPSIDGVGVSPEPHPPKPV